MTEDPVRDGLNWYGYCHNDPINFIDLYGMAEVGIRNWIESRGGEVNPVKYDFGIFSAFLKQVNTTLGGKTVTYTSDDYKIKNDRACIDDSILMRDFYTTGMGAAKPYNEVKSNENRINCYAYAIDYNDNAQPGFTVGVLFNYEKPYSVETVAFYVKTDLGKMGRTARIIDSYNSPILNNERRIAIRVGTNVNEKDNKYDYYFMKQNNDGTWAEKHGIRGNSIKHKKGKNPDNISWDLGKYKNYYNSNIIYMAITN